MCFNERHQYLIEPAIASRQGRIVKTTGDDLLVGFASAVGAVRCAVEFQEGITEYVNTELSRFDDLFVIARNTSFTYKGQRVDVKEVARELGVHFILKVGVRKAAERIAEHISALEP